MIALGVIAAVRLASKRLEAQGVGSRDDMSSIAMWAVPAGVVGSRLYHVITDWSRFDGDVVEMAKIWKGGLGIWGGIALGVPVGLYVAHRRGLSTGPALTCGACVAVGAGDWSVGQLVESRIIWACHNIAVGS